MFVNNSRKDKNTSNSVRPFDSYQSKNKDYRYFDIAWMTRAIEFTKSVCKEAQHLIQTQQFVWDCLEFGYLENAGNRQLLGTAYGYAMDGKRKSFRVRILFDADHICEAECDDYFHYHFYDFNDIYSVRSVNKYEMALLYLLAAYLEKNNPGDATDLGGVQILESFQQERESQIISDVAKASRDIRLEPRLEKNQDGWKASFRIGDKKMFVVKNMTDLVRHVEEKEVLPLGVSASLNFMNQSFHEQSLPYYEWMESIVREEKNRKKRAISQDYYYDPRQYEVKAHIYLEGRRLDEFFEMAKGDELEYTDKTGNGNKKMHIRLTDKHPTMHLQISRMEKTARSDEFRGIRVDGRVSEVVEGDKYIYFVEEESFCRAKKEEIREILPLLQMSQEGEVSFQIGRRKLSAFYYSLLPILRTYGTVEEVDLKQIEPYLPPEVSFRFYLDLEDGRVTCRAKAIYGQQEESPLDVMRENIQWMSWRDPSKESEIAYRLRQIFPELDLKEDILHTGNDEDVVYEVMEQGVGQMLSMGEVHTTERFRSLNVRRHPKIHMGVSVESDIMNLSIMTEDISMEELLEALNSYQRKKKYYRLKNGDFMSVNEDAMETLSQMMDTLHITPKEFVKGKIQIPSYRALYLDKMLEQSEEIYSTRNSHFKKLIKDFKTINESDYEVPNTLQATMRNYQVLGYKWLRTLDSCGFGGILADDMGLGKTLQMITVLLAGKMEGNLQPSLVVAPASLVYNWKEEFGRFAPQLSVQLIVGTQKERAQKIAEYKNYDVLVTSYDLLKRDIAEYEDCVFKYQIIDEAQYIKNHATAVAKSVKIIKSSTRYALTGTPIENRLSELWSIFDYLMPGFLYRYDTFKKEIESPIVKNKDEKATQRLKKMVSPFILRRTKKDVLKDLPDKLEEVRYAKLDEKQRKLYDGQVVHMKQMLQRPEEDFQSSKIKVLAELMRIRQICCDPSLLLENYDGPSAKKETCMELVRSAVEGEHKVLIFSQFTSMLEILEKELQESNIDYYKITGETPKKRRVEMVQEYNQNAVPVFLISLKAGGTGLNLTGADVVIHYDPWWNLAVQNQATDRAHRIGQTKVVVVYKLIVKDSIEEKIMLMQEAKKNLADEILSGEMGGISGLSKEELLQLIES